MLAQRLFIIFFLARKEMNEEGGAGRGGRRGTCRNEGRLSVLDRWGGRRWCWWWWEEVWGGGDGGHEGQRQGGLGWGVR